MNNNTVNIFFACDDNYIPFLAVTLQSIKENCNKNKYYKIFVLNSGISKDNISNISKSYTSPNFKIEFCDITNELNAFASQLHTRDYYSKSTYYRLFIPTLFPNINKALYLDCDIVVKDDISKLFDFQLGNNLVAAVPDSFVAQYKELQLYVENRIGVKSYEKYFNAGVLLMNLKELREFAFKDKFINLLQTVKFDVAQDQDYLNALCYARVKFIQEDWNFMPLECKTENEKPSLVHFNLDYKPWKKDGILFSDLFWYYAEKTMYFKDIKNIKANFSKENVEKAKEQTKNLVLTCLSQGSDEITNKKIQEQINLIREDKHERTNNSSVA